MPVVPLLRLYNISPHTSRRMIQQFLGSASGPTAGRKHQFLSHSWARSCPWKRMWKRQWTISRLGKWKLTLPFNFVCICLSYFFSLIKIHWEHGWGLLGRTGDIRNSTPSKSVGMERDVLWLLQRLSFIYVTPANI